jgi:hypothetical protein
MRSADEGASRAIGFGRDTAGIHHHNVGGEGLAFGKRPQMSGDGLAVGACRAAAEVLNEKTRHRPSLVNFWLRSDSPDAGLTI